MKYKVIHKQLKQTYPIINSYKCLRLKIEKTFYNLLCETTFQAFLHVYFIFSLSSLLENSHILRSVR
jgi:hypothetical protein